MLPYPRAQVTHICAFPHCSWLQAYGSKDSLLHLKEDKYSGEQVLTGVNREHSLMQYFRYLLPLLCGLIVCSATWCNACQCAYFSVCSATSCKACQCAYFCIRTSFFATCTPSCLYCHHQVEQKSRDTLLNTKFSCINACLMCAGLSRLHSCLVKPQSWQALWMELWAAAMVPESLPQMSLS